MCTVPPAGTVDGETLIEPFCAAEAAPASTAAAATPPSNATAKSRLMTAFLSGARFGPPVRYASRRPAADLPESAGAFFIGPDSDPAESLVCGDCVTKRQLGGATQER